MRRVAALTLAFVFAAFLVGCGGTNGTNNNNGFQSVFTGNYSGTYTNSGNVNQGTIAITVDNDGVFGGTVSGTESGNLSGTLNNNGTISNGLLTNFNAQPSQTVSGTLSLSGGALTGPVTFTPNVGSPSTFNVNLPAQP